MIHEYEPDGDAAAVAVAVRWSTLFGFVVFVMW